MKKSVLLISLLSGTALMLPNLAFTSDISTHTLTYTPKPELSFEFAKLDKAFKVASVCFLGYGDCGDGGFGSIDGDDGYAVDTIKQCTNEGFVNTCSSGYCMDRSCPYNSAYGKCIVNNCPENSATNCTGATVAQNNCGEDCKKCCDDSCPSGAKNYTGSYASTTECGTTCYNCNTTCPSGSSTSYTGTSVGTNECGQSCKKCNSSCPSGYTSSPTSECYDTTTNECGNTCYKEKDCDPCAGYYECGGTWQYCEGSTCPADSSRCSVYCESDHFPYSCGSDYGPCYGDYRSGYCSVPCDKIETDPCADVSGLSCSNGCASYGSCGQCTSCNPTPPSDPCEGVSCPTSVNCGSAGCASYSSSTSCCSSVCTSCNEEPDDPCAGVTGVSCSYGCASYGSCGECTACNGNPCDSVTAVSIPSNASCTSYYPTCSTKCSAWSCNSGYTQSGSSCVATCETNPCRRGCYTDISCTYGCKSRNSCGGCEVCYTEYEDTCIALTGSPDCDQENGYLK